MEVGWRLDARYWGRGYATEGARAALAYGFGVAGLDEIVSMTTVTNVRSIAVMERLGMHRAGEFEHPHVPAGHALRPHVLYHLGSSALRADTPSESAKRFAKNADEPPSGRLLSEEPAATYSPGPLRRPSTIGAVGLNCSVRNGKRCFPHAKATGNCRDRVSADPQNHTACQHHGYQKYPSSPRPISTGLLRVLPRFQIRPINLVVYQGSYSLKGMGELISRSASRLDAFSGYPIRT